jgi:Alpha 1,4-glycosyltransferase conserved region
MATLQSLWIGAALSPIEAVCIRSFLSRGHTFDLFVYGDVDNVPDGCNRHDARSVLDEARIFAYRQGPGKGSVSGFSNVFRYKLLLDRGGWWVDLDVVCTGEPLSDVDVALAPEDDKYVNGAIIKFPPGHPAMAYAYSCSAAIGANMAWGECGPSLMTKLVPMFRLEPALMPRRSFYPIHWREASKLIDPAHREYVENQIRGAVFVHLWNEKFRRANYDKFVRPPRGSYLYGLLETHDMLRGFRWEYVAESAGDRVRMRRVPLDSIPSR